LHHAALQRAVLRSAPLRWKKFAALHRGKLLFGFASERENEVR
jgi:hypothetical protein